MWQELAERVVVALEGIPAALRENTKVLKEQLHFRQGLVGEVPAAEPEAPAAAGKPAEAPKKISVKVKTPAPEPEKPAAEITDEEVIEYAKVVDEVQLAYQRAEEPESKMTRGQVQKKWKEHVATFGVNSAKDIDAKHYPALIEFIKGII